MKIVSKSDVGRVRRSNQDSYAAGELPGGVSWAVVCDGMGGPGGGKLASRLAVDTFQNTCLGNLRRDMTWEQVRTMKRHGMYIGIHGYDHYWLAHLSEEQMRADIDKALRVMDEFIDAGAWVMNYPYGNYNEQVIRYIQNRGCCLGFTTEVRAADLNRENPYKLPRLDCNDFPPKSDNFKKM